jgi:hypothetical protein
MVKKIFMTSVPGKGIQSQLASSTCLPEFKLNVKICITVNIILVLPWGD